MSKNKIIKRSLYISSSCVLAAILFLIATYLINIHSINQQYYDRYNAKSQVALRKFPYPYRAAMTISSDIDGTKTLEQFLEIQKFLNTTEMTSMGKGVGLEIGSSFLFYEPPNSAISYFLGGPGVAQTIRSFIQSGYIDVLHSYGRKSDFSREDAIKALGELKKNNCKVDVWVDHDRSISNLGKDNTAGLGDVPNSVGYHADLTVAYGIKFVWRGTGTMITGQSVPIGLKTFTGIFDSDHPLRSLVNISKEFAKNVVAGFGNKKYAMHRNNDLVKVTDLNDGQKVYEFMRFDDYWEGVSTGGNNKRLAYVISPKTLTCLKEVGGYMIVYTQLGMNSDCTQYICIETQHALRNLAKEFEEGNIYVTTTSRLLNYYIHHKYLDWSYELRDREVIIRINSIKDPILGSFIPTVGNLEGITFYVPGNKRTRIFAGQNEIEGIQRNLPDDTGRESVSIPVTHSKFPRGLNH